MDRVERFEDLRIWQDARKMVTDVYALIGTNTKIERDFGFKDQLRRAALSVMNNIAEGFERNGDRAFRQFLNISKSSCGEVRSMIYVAVDLMYISKDKAEILIEDLELLSRKFYSLMKYLDDSSKK